MPRLLAVVAIVALALPPLAFAQGHEEDPHHQGGRKLPPARPGGGPPPGAGPAFVPHGPPHLRHFHRDEVLTFVTV